MILGSWTEYLSDRIQLRIIRIVFVATVTVRPNEQIRGQILDKMQRNKIFLDKNIIIQQFPKIGSWKCVNLSALSCAAGPNLFYQIRQISFPCLRDIIFQFSSISSIQPLMRLHAPSLQTINLLKNNITCIRPIIKLQSFRISELYLGNMFPSLLDISLLFCHKFLVLGIQITKDEESGCSDLGPLIKVPFFQNLSMYTYSKSRIPQNYLSKNLFRII